MFEQEIAVLQVLFPNLRFDDSRYSACVCMCSKNIQQLTVDVVVKSFMWSFLWKLEKRDRQLRQNTSASLMWRFGRLSFSAVQLVQVLRESILEDVETESGKYLLLFNHLYSHYTHWNIFAYHSEDLDQIWQLFRLIWAQLLHGPPEIALTETQEIKAESLFSAVLALWWSETWDFTGDGMKPVKLVKCRADDS